MKREKIKAFINYGVNKNITAGNSIKMVLGLDIFYIIGIFIGFILGGTELVFSVIILIVTVISTVLIIVKSIILSYKNYFIILGTISLEGTINFLLMSFILCQMLEADILINVVIILIPLFSMILNFIIIKNRINKGYYLNSKVVNNKKLGMISSLGGIAGMLFAKRFLVGVGQSAAILIGIGFCLFLSSIFSIGTINFLKLNYIETYFSNESNNLINNPEANGVEF